VDSLVAAVSLSSIAAGFGLGIALAGAPGPVQAVILTETVRGGMQRGLRAQIGANGTFLVLVACLALGLSLVAPGGTVLRAIQVVGGAFLIWLGVDGFQSAGDHAGEAEERRSLAPLPRGILAVILNPGVWLFLTTAASSLVTSAAHNGGTASALGAALALTLGLAIGDTAVVLVGSLGVRRAGDRVVLWVRRLLTLGLVALGIWVLASGVIG
jgi:threonine/homoserine/homoserine lactone efflux protein